MHEFMGDIPRDFHLCLEGLIVGVCEALLGSKHLGVLLHDSFKQDPMIYEDHTPCDLFFTHRLGTFLHSFR